MHVDITFYIWLLFIIKLYKISNTFYRAYSSIIYSFVIIIYRIT
jgi:hypothetical protein